MATTRTGVSLKGLFRSFALTALVGLCLLVLAGGKVRAQTYGSGSYDDCTYNTCAESDSRPGNSGGDTTSTADQSELGVSQTATESDQTEQSASNPVTSVIESTKDSYKNAAREVVASTWWQKLVATILFILAAFFLALMIKRRKKDDEVQ